MGAAAPILPYLIAAGATAAQYVNTRNAANRQDEAMAEGIRDQSRIQREGDAKVDDTLTKLAGSNAEASRQARLDDYLQVLRQNRGSTQAGLAPVVGSGAFRTDAKDAAGDAQDYATRTAGLLARMDAPQIQRQQEGFDYGNLATDLGLIGRESQGQAFLNQLRLNRIRRNPKIDLASGLAMAGAGAAARYAGSPSAFGYGGGTPMSGGSTIGTGGGYTANLPY